MSADQKALADVLVVFTALAVYIFRAVFAILLFILVIKAIKYFHNKNKCDCATCIYKQKYNQQEIQDNLVIISKDG